jgi:hypothetical protein
MDNILDALHFLKLGSDYCQYIAQGYIGELNAPPSSTYPVHGIVFPSFPLQFSDIV